MKKLLFAIATSCFALYNTHAQEKEEPILYGNMDHWVVRNITESGIIGGNQKTL